MWYRLAGQCDDMGGCIFSACVGAGCGRQQGNVQNIFEGSFDRMDRSCGKREMTTKKIFKRRYDGLNEAQKRIHITGTRTEHGGTADGIGPIARFGGSGGSRSHSTRLPHLILDGLKLAVV